MKQYLSLAQTSGSDFRKVILSTVEPECEDTLTYSPIYSFSEYSACETSLKKKLLFIFPYSTSKAAAYINSILEDESVYFTHGLASIVITLDDECLLLDQKYLSDYIVSIEVWEISDSGELIRTDLIDYKNITEYTLKNFKVDYTGIHQEEALSQFKQLNGNISQAARYASRYAPALLPLLQSVAIAANNISEELKHGYSSGSGNLIVFKEISEIVEMNAAMSMLISQSFSSIPTITESRFPVAQHSLLGIGGSLLSIYRITKHLSDMFHDENELDRITEKYRETKGFNPFVKNYRDFTINNWSKHYNTEVDRIPCSAPCYDRCYQIPSFSSRWGFNATKYTISVAWQCLISNSTKGWNLLTLSHEFLHAHVVGILHGLLPVNDEEMDDLIFLWNKHDPDKLTLAQSSQLTIMQFVYFRYVIDNSREAAEKKRKPGKIVSEDASVNVTKENTVRLLERHWDYMNEIIVHVLDYSYFYDEDDWLYVSSLWHSWSLIPSVSTRLEYYIQRTICALASADKTPTEKSDYNIIFDNAVKRFLENLGKFQNSQVAESVIEILKFRDSLERIRNEFAGNWKLVFFIRTYLFSARLKSKLRADSTRGGPNYSGRAYEFLPLYFNGESPESPVGFLLERFRKTASDGNNLDYEKLSLWQMLLLNDFGGNDE